MSYGRGRLSDYERLREANIKERVQVLESMGLLNVRSNSALNQLLPQKPKGRPVKRIAPTGPQEPTRRSLRLVNKSSDGSSLGAGDYNWDKLARKSEAEAAAQIRKRNKGTLGMLDYVHKRAYDDDRNELIDELRALELARLGKGSVSPPMEEGQMSLSLWESDSSRLESQLELLSWSTPTGEEQGLKVTPDRGYSLSFLPGGDRIVIACGDKGGCLGISAFQASNHGGNSSEVDVTEPVVAMFTPHISPINGLLASPFESGSPNLYTCSYDGSVRLTDFEKGQFTELYAVSEEDDLCKWICFKDPNCLVVALHFGSIALIDIRQDHRREGAAKFGVDGINLRTMSFHPLQPDNFILTDKDHISLYDIRKMKTDKRTNYPIWQKKGGGKTTSSAFLSPISGSKLLSANMDDRIYIHDTSTLNGDDVKVILNIRHNNHTGRWLTRFRPVWHPKSDEFFLTASMEYPRKAEVISANGKLVRRLTGCSSIPAIGCFHPELALAAGVSSSGRIHFWST